MDNQVTAVEIETSIWNKIMGHFISVGWKIVYKYDLFDAGIDFDLVVIEKDRERILFGWDNWFEGEIQCSADQLKYLTTNLGYAFTIGEPGTLKPEVVSIFWKG